MYRKITIFVISLMMMNSLPAQVSYGIRFGANFSKWDGDDIQIIEDLIDKTDGYLQTRGKTGYHVGGYVRIPISDYFVFEPGLQYSKKGYALEGDFQIPVLKYVGLNVGARVQSHYFDIPLVIKANPVGGLMIYGGPQLSLMARSTLNAKLGILGISIFNKGFGITERFNRTDLGLVGGIGYEFDNGLNVQAGYEHGLTPLDKHSNYEAYNRVVKVSVGYTF